MSQLPSSLQSLLTASAENVDDAWSVFVAEYSPLLLHVARSVSHGRDQAMDAYAHVLEQLRRDQCQRLRRYETDPRSRFTTWLVIVCRRLCVDFHRAHFGRARAE
ncbi:MAG TPA: sigma factor, partial [Gemmatimonadaceae bacterium]|nr:sigma factor [Gemmatimonadaceae bacterium]